MTASLVVLGLGALWCLQMTSVVPTDEADATSEAEDDDGRGPLLAVARKPSDARAADAGPTHTASATVDIVARGQDGITRPDSFEQAMVLLGAQHFLLFMDEPRAPGAMPDRDPTLGDPGDIPVVLREAWVAAATRDDAAAPWWEQRTGRFGSHDSLVVSLADTEEKQTQRDEEPPALVTAIVGRIVDEQQAPVAGARIVIYSAFYERHVNYGHRIREVGTATTDADGRYDLRPIALDTVHFGSNGEVVLSVASPGYADVVSLRLRNIQPEVENDIGTHILTQQSASLRGRLIDRSGAPVAGAIVRVSGSLQPTLYDKQERLVFLRHCPTATTDENGEYELSGFAAGHHFVSIHVNIDSPWTEMQKLQPGENVLNLTLRVGGSIRGTVRDPAGEPVADAIVYGGENYTHSLADGTFWLDNITKGPQTLWVVHHEYKSLTVRDVPGDSENLDIQFVAPLPRLTLRVTQGEERKPSGLIAVTWEFPNGQQSLAVPASPYWHNAKGEYSIPIPERATAARVQVEDMAVEILSLAEAAEGLERDLHVEPWPQIEEIVEPDSDE